VTSVTPCITHVEQIPWRPGRPASWPGWVAPPVRTALDRQGIDRPWSHQAEAAELAFGGQDVVVATGTASGKSLAYQLPALTAIAANPRSCVLYLAPTKALAADQLQSLESLEMPGLRPAAYDGDSPMVDRDWARAHANWVLTNPDMLHRGMLPSHDRWARVLRRLKYVVVDECHTYRGVFGSHVALVLRRLIRLARMYGSDPVFVFASATSADPQGSASRLIGRPVRAVTQDGAPRPGADFVFWEPAVVSGNQGLDGAPVRRSAAGEAARMMADLVADGARTLTFVRSRHGAEQTALSAKRRLGETAPELVDKVAAYRGGYLPEERRELERALDSGELMGVASTNALELGVDIEGLDAAILAGYPGTLASMWQQAGRAGRRADSGRRALVVFVARDDPLDTYLVHHPARVFGRPIEASIIDPTNPYILGPHLACAAAERHLTEADLALFGGPSIKPIVQDLVDRRVLRARPTGWFWAEPGHPADRVNLRGGGGGQVAIVDEDTARLLGTVDLHRAPAAVHTGAVHLHRGESYVVQDLDLHHGVALVRPERPDWTTIARSTSTVSMPGLGVAPTHRERSFHGGVRVGIGPVEVTEQVTGYLRRRPDGELIDVIGLDMPRHTLHTRAVWYTVTLDALLAAGICESRVPGALHAAEHAAIGLLPLFAGCDRWDIGGLSTALHADTGEPTVIVYDGYPGGAGFADRGHDVLAAWLGAVRDAVAGCACEAGCPSCVQSPKCGNGNQPLDKDGAVIVLETVLGALAPMELLANA
jgi:DEAD/DEAH box helicase domain-containing protein